MKTHLVSLMVIALAFLPTLATAQIRSVHVSVIGKDGSPILDMKPAEFEIKDGARTVEIVDAKKASTPLRVAILVADGGTGGFQQGLASILQQLQGLAEISLVSVVEQPEIIVDYTSDVDALIAGIQRMGPRAKSRSSGQLMEAVNDALRTVPRPNHRTAIIVMRAGGAGSSPIRADVVRDTMRKNGTRLYVLAAPGSGTGGGTASSGGGGTGNIGIAQSGLAQSESASRGRDLEVVLTDGAKESGGRYEQIATNTLVKAAQLVADELESQYQVVYALAEGEKPSDRIEVTVKRKDAKVQAPTRVPN